MREKTEVEPSESERRARLYFSLVNAGDFGRVLDLVHPDVEIALKIRPGETLRGRAEVERFFHDEVASRTVFEAIVSDVRSLDEDRVIVSGRIRWMDDDRVLRDDPVFWALEFADGLLRRSTPTRSMGEAQVLLSAAS